MKCKGGGLHYINISIFEAQRRDAHGEGVQ